MATIALTDELGLDESVSVAPFSSLLKYFQQLPALHMSSGDLSKAGGLTLDQPALTALSGGLSFDKSVSIGPDATTISIPACAHGSLELILRTPAVVTLVDVYSGDIGIAEGTCYVAFGLQAALGVSVTAGAALLQFGVGAGRDHRHTELSELPAEARDYASRCGGENCGQFRHSRLRR